MSQFFLLTFYTEGAPHDAGEDLRKVEAEFRHLVIPHTDRYIAYCPRTIKSDGPIAEMVCADYRQWVEIHPLRHQLVNYNPVWARIGFVSWKPYIIRKLLWRDDVQFGDIILYHDVNIEKYAQYRDYVDEWRELSRQLLEHLGCDLFVPVGFPLQKDVKAYLIRKYLGDAHRRDFGLWAGIMVLRKSPAIMSFVDEWMKMCQDLDNLSPLPNPDPYSGFFWNSGEQSVLAVLARQWCLRGQLPYRWPRFTADLRRFGFRSMVEEWPPRPSGPPRDSVKPPEIEFP
jgi:hypothetical protein